MATDFKSNIGRLGETVVHPLTTVVLAAASTVFTVGSEIMPSGTYQLSLSVSSSVNGTTTTFTVKPFVEKDQGAATDLGFQAADVGGGADAAPQALGAGAEGHIFRFVQSTESSGNAHEFHVPYGLEITLAKGTAVTGELLETALILTRVS